ncbi:EAL domain-containing protein [Sphingomonas sp. LHG3406-1]|uniref:EAL domain-containing protein n=1 Tax=Sphingomonas sp. LHG3406-1 TaxID=2804617 RepID=UPI00260C2A01|nr:EAL domain-containing protein [Sphingomonas sp. LHG3406-1]
MRRTRVDIQPADGRRPVRVSVREAMTFDVLPPETDDDFTLQSKRIAMWAYAPWLLAATHFIVGIILLMRGGAEGGQNLLLALLPVAIAIALDLAAGTMLLMRRKLSISPVTTSRLVMLWFAATGVLWMMFGRVTDPGLIDSSFLPLALGAGLAVKAMLSIGSPSAAIINALLATIGVHLFSDDPLIKSAIPLLGMACAFYSIVITRMMLASSRRRLALDWQAKKALNFVEEFENSGRGWFWETNPAGTLSYVSQQLADDFKTTPDALLGRQFNDLLSVDTGSGDALREERTLGFHLSARFPFSDVVVRPASDQDVHWSLSGNPIFDDNGRFLGFRGIGTDLTEQRRSEQEISRLARFDSLTGLPNRAMMRQTLDEGLRNAKHRQKGCALFLIDLDRFKNVNDTLGHPAGDALLKQVAQRLTSVMGEHGQIGRLGGDEFKAVLPGTVDIGLLESLAKTLIEQVSRPYMLDGHRVTIGASVGIAIGDPGRSCADSMIRNADLALYAAKADGRGRHRFYEHSMHSEATNRQMLENDLRGAIERDELCVVYQPIVRAAGEELAGFEALVRWNHPKQGPISPAKFIPLAEECGLINPIGEWVLNQALAAARAWPENIRVAVNLSPIQFNDPKIVDVISAALQASMVKPARLELEITEGVFLADSDVTDVTFARLKELGVRLALDDFGTGYSSLGYLKKAPFDKIKIDQSFVRGAASRSNRNAAIIRAIVTLAESLNMDTVAEGVETHDDLQLMRDLGVSQIQGYIFGRPADFETSSKLARASVVEADGHQYVREPRQRLMRRALIAIDGNIVEVRLRNISAMGALVECVQPVTPGNSMTIDIVGVGPVTGSIRWAQRNRFGVRFDEQFDLGRLAARPLSAPAVQMLKPWYVDRKTG